MDTRETALLLFVEMEKTKNFGSSLICGCDTAGQAEGAQRKAADVPG